MALEKLIAIMAKLLPSKKVFAYALAAVVAIASAFLGVAQTELKDAYCKSDIQISLPGAEK